MGETPRHLFAPECIHPSAYGDHPLPIGPGATITQPQVVAAMTELLDPGESDRVLEIGTGSGYQAAILAQLAGHVYTIEIRPELVRLARENLKRQGLANLTQREGDGFYGWPEEAPFSRILLTVAPHAIPQALLDQLSFGGRLVAPAGAWEQQELVLIEKSSSGEVRCSLHGRVAFVPLIRSLASS